MFDYNRNDTISAISTPIGEGAISIVRLSGKDAISIASKMFFLDLKNFENNRAYLKKILDGKDLIDNAIIIFYKAPNSFTGEDIIEIQCHGGKLVTQKILYLTIKLGARLANPGEFSLRAFLNKKIDLIQAESIQDLISSKNKFAMQAAKNQLDGKLSLEIKKYQNELLEILAIIEASLDFPEEALEYFTKDELLKKLNDILNQMQKLSDTFEDGKILKEGKSICIIGTPNVGKSSLMNAMLKEDRAIVTEISGTTRDVLKEDIIINDMNYHLIDTAGIRDTTCIIEKEGIKRSKKESSLADIVILILDATRSLNDEDKKLLQDIDKEKTIIVWNKTDLKKPLQKLDLNALEISAKENINLSLLYNEITKLTFKEKFSNDQIIITKKRHKIALDESITFLKKAIKAIQEDSSYEFVTIDLKDSLKELSKIIGIDITEEILSSIFSKFCIGK